MQNASTPSSRQTIGVSLVDGDSTIRHARQLMLRSEDYDVRSYATCAALLADPRSRDYPCIILDLEMEDVDGLALLREMRGSGWRGKAILLDGLDPGSAMLIEAERHGDTLFARNIGNRALLTEIASSIDHGWAGWNAED
ncbi:response regulator [Sphingomonas sp. LR60]|uniref:response regulator n=1 Tax=Sphingomonas sp. LR60 TaxID=3050233 RepID=UPI002FE0E4F2